MYLSFKTLYCYYLRKSSEDWNVRYLMMLKWIGNNHKCNWVMLHLATWTFKVHVEYNVKRIIIKVNLQRELCYRQTQTRIRQTSWDKCILLLDWNILHLSPLEIDFQSQIENVLSTLNTDNMKIESSYFSCSVLFSINWIYFFRYEMSNCLFESAYEETLRVCNCVPSFHQVAMNEASWLRICTGTKLKCMKKIFHGIGNYKMVRHVLLINK